MLFSEVAQRVASQHYLLLAERERARERERKSEIEKEREREREVDGRH